MFHPLGLRSQMTVCDPLCPAGNAWGVGGVDAARLSVLYVCMHRQVHRVRTKTIDAASDTGDTTRLVSSWLAGTGSVHGIIGGSWHSPQLWQRTSRPACACGRKGGPQWGGQTPTNEPTRPTAVRLSGVTVSGPPTTS